MIKSVFQYSFTVFLLFVSLQLSAQIIAPTPICVRADSIFFEIPTSFCGDFEDYVLLGSNTENGIYEIIDTIVDMNQDVYFHQNPNGLTWYYFMQTDADCMGEIPLNSDTINNIIPPTIPIDYVTILDNQVEIEWSPSTFSQVVGYTINRVTNSGTTTIDTVYDGTSYVDLGASVVTGSEIYYVLAIDACNNASIFDAPHYTTHLTSTVSTCQRSILLNWNPYQNWTEGIEKQELWVSINGSDPELIADLDADTNSFNYLNVKDDNIYCFYIEGVEKATSFRSRSNELCQPFDIQQELSFTNMTITDDQTVELGWYWNTDAELEDYQITGLASGIEISSSDFTVVPPLVVLNNYIDPIIAQDEAYIYTISTSDNCDTINHLFLEGMILPSRDYHLNWTALDNPNAFDIVYELYRIDALGARLVTTINNMPLEITDMYDPSETTEPVTCYFVEAVATVVLPNGISTNIRSRSNTTCLTQEVALRSPNAFTPNGKNPIFKPVVAFSEVILNYKMLIFDRWGGLVFESNQVENGWDGRNKNGKDMPQGVYTFMIQLQQASGAYLEDQGALMLLR